MGQLTLSTRTSFQLVSDLFISLVTLFLQAGPDLVFQPSVSAFQFLCCCVCRDKCLQSPMFSFQTRQTECCRWCIVDHVEPPENINIQVDLLPHAMCCFLRLAE